MAEKLNWEFEEDEDKPKSVDELINYFQNVIEENSKPEYSSEEVEALDNFVKQGGDLKKYLTIDAELDLDDIDIDTLTHINEIAKKMHILLKEKLNIDGMSIMQNNGDVQEVKHYHMHLKPYYKENNGISVEEVYKKLIG